MSERPSSADSRAGAPARLLDLLPELYRRHGGRVFARYVGVAQALLDAVHGATRDLARADPVALLARAGLECATLDRRAGATTARELRRRFGEPLPCPEIWSARRVVDADDGVLEVHEPGDGLAIVLAWTRAELARPPDALELSEDDLPVGVDVQAVLLDGPTGLRVPVPGMRLGGVIFWVRRPGTFVEASETVMDTSGAGLDAQGTASDAEPAPGR